MNLPQENFERAIEHGKATLADLPNNPILEQEQTSRLQGWMWDLEAIGAAIRLELMNRETNEPVDLG